MANWYVDSAAAGGGNGAIGTPWNSIASIGGTPQAGDTVYFSGGANASSKTYTASNWTPPGGASGTPITYAVWPGSSNNGTVIINGSYPQISGNPAWFTFDGNDGNNNRHMTFNGGISVGSNGTGQNILGLRFLYLNINGIIQLLYGPSQYEIGWCQIICTNGSDVALYFAADYLGPANAYDVNSIHDCFINCWNNIAIGGGDDFIRAGNSVSVHHNYFKGLRANGTPQQPAGGGPTQTQGSYLGTQHQDAMQWAGSFTKIYSNIIENCANSSGYMDYTGSVNDVQYYNNIVMLTDPAFNPSPPASSTVGFTIAHDQGGSSATLTNFLIANNIFVGFQFKGVDIGGSNVNGTNTIYGSGWVVENNIFVNCGSNNGGNSGVGGPNGNSSGFGGVVQQNNVNLTSAQSASEFVSYTAFNPAVTQNYHLLSGDSNLIGQATVLSSFFTTDKDGNARGATWDIGPYEFAGVGGTITLNGLTGSIHVSGAGGPTAIPKDDRFGFATHFGQGWPTSLMPLIAATGVGYIRDDLSSTQWEPSPGTFQISASNKVWCDAAHANGLKVVGIITGNSTYTTDYYDPTLIANRAAFIAQSGLVDIIEVLNEPNNAYQAHEVSIGRNWLTDLPILTTAITNAVNSVSSTVQVIGLGAQGSQIWGMYPSTTLDGVCYHPYDTGNASPASDKPETCYEQPSGVNATSSLIYKPWIQICRGQTALPLWETEWGVQWGTSIAGFSQDNQSCYLARRLLASMGLAVEHTFIYEFKDNSSSDLFGVYLIDNVTPKASYGLVTRVISSLSGVVGTPSSPVTITSGPANATAYAYQGTNKTVVSSWIGNSSPSSPPAASTCTLTFSVPNPNINASSTVYDPIADTSVPLSTYTTSLSGGIFTISGLPITDHPLLILLDTASASTSTPPTPVQHMATGMDRNFLGTFTVTYPNKVGAGNCLIAGIQYNGSLQGGTATPAVTSITDNLGNTWLAGPQTSNTSFQNVNIYYVVNALPGICTITIAISNLNAQESSAAGVFSEFYNVTTVSGATDGSAASNSNFSPGPVTTQVAGDLIYHYAINGSAITPNGGGYNSTTPMVAGAGFTLLSADLQIGSLVQYTVQASAGSITPTFTKSGSDTWESLAFAIKAAPGAGTAPSGMYIAHKQHTLISSAPQSRTTVTGVQFPSQGNLIVAKYDSGAVNINSVSDSAGNTWRKAASINGPPVNPPAATGGLVITEMWYASPATTGNTLSAIKVVESAATTADEMLILYDVVGAAASAFGNATSAQGIASSAGPITMISNFAPVAANGIVFAGDSQDYGSFIGVNGANFFFDAAWNNLNHNTPSGTQTSTLDEDNASAHYFNPNTAPISFTFTYNLPTDVVNRWSAVAASFKPAGATAGPAVIQGPLNSTLASGGSITKAYGAAMTAHSLLVCFINWGAATGTITSVSDGLNGAWTLAKLEQGNINSAECYYVLNGAAGAAPTVTVTFGASVSSPELVIYEIAPATGQFWSLDGTPNGATGTASPTTGNITTSGSNDLLFACFSGNATETAATPGFSLYLTTFTNSVGMEFVTSPGTYSCTWTTATTTNACLIAGFKTGSSIPVNPGPLTGNIRITGLCKPTLSTHQIGTVHVTAALAPTIALPSLSGDIVAVVSGIIAPALGLKLTGAIGVTGTVRLQSVGAGPLTGSIAISGAAHPSLVLASSTGSVAVSGATTVQPTAYPVLSGQVAVSGTTTAQPTAFVNNQSGSIAVSGVVNPNLAGLTGNIAITGTTAVQPTAFATSLTGSVALSGTTTAQPTAFVTSLTGSLSVSGAMTVTLTGTTVTLTGLSGLVGVSGLVKPSLSTGNTGGLSVTGVLSPLIALAPTLSGQLAVTGLVASTRALNLSGTHGIVGGVTAQYIGTIAHNVTGAVSVNGSVVPTLILPGLSGAVSVTGIAAPAVTAFPTGTGTIGASGTLNPTLILSGNTGTVGVSGALSVTLSGTLTLTGLTGTVGVTAAPAPSMVLPSMSGAVSVTTIVNPTLSPIVNGTIGVSGALALSIAPALAGQVSVTGATTPSVALKNLAGAVSVTGLINPTAGVLALPNLDGTVSITGLVNPTLDASGAESIGTVGVSGVLSIQFAATISLDGLVGSVSTSALVLPALGLGTSGAMSLLGAWQDTLSPTGTGVVGVSGTVTLILSSGPQPPEDVTISLGSLRGSVRIL